jgi:hypothetical protein
MSKRTSRHASTKKLELVDSDEDMAADDNRQLS